ncbi:hypothetical protein QAO49_07730 [Staphylococcus aureus]
MIPNFKIYEWRSKYRVEFSKLKDVNQDVIYSNDNKTATVDLMKGQTSSNKTIHHSTTAYPDNSSTDNGKN